MAWINSIFLVMNLLILLRVFYWLSVRASGGLRIWLSRAVELLFGVKQRCIGSWRNLVRAETVVAPAL